jgi:hypothetical protein
MLMSNAYLEVIGGAGRTAVTHIALVNGSGTEVGAARIAVTSVGGWTATDGDGDFQLAGNMVFAMSSGQNVSGWKGFSALTGGTDFGGGALTPVTFGNDGTYTLTAAATGINHTASGS